KVALLLVFVGIYSVYLAGCTGAADAGPRVSGTPENALTVPLMPSNLAATAGNAQVTLAWNPSNGATSYHIKRSTMNGGPYTQVAAPSATGYVDAAVANETTYYYAVSAVGSAGE